MPTDSRPQPTVRIAHAEWGDAAAPVLLLLHGFPLASSMWTDVATLAAKTGFRVLAPDLRGHGASPVGDVGATIDDYARDVLALLDRLRIDTVALAGFSMGGYVALSLLAQAARRVRGLALIDTRADADSEEGKKARAETAEAVKAKGMAVLTQRMVPKFFTPEGLRKDPSLAERAKAIILRNPPAGAVAALGALASRPDRADLLPTIRVPTLICVGEADELTPVSASQAMAQAIPGARLEILPKAAHLGVWERAEEFQLAFLAWLVPLAPAARRVAPKS